MYDISKTRVDGPSSTNFKGLVVYYFALALHPECEQESKIVLFNKRDRILEKRTDDCLERSLPCSRPNKRKNTKKQRRNRTPNTRPLTPTSPQRKSSHHETPQKKDTHHKVPSTSNTIPFSNGAPDKLLFSGSRGANRLGGLRVVWLIARPSRMHGFLQRWRVRLENTKVMGGHLLKCAVDG